MIEINKCKLVPGITASWGDITGNIENQTDLVSYISTHGGGGGAAAWGSISGTLTDQTDLMDYMSSFATQSWVSSQGYLSSTALTGYATQSWVESQGYLTEHQDLTGYATESWVSSQGYLSATALTGYATESWVSGQGYLVSDDLSQYATRQWVTGRGYVSSSDLSSYATQSWIAEQGYIGSSGLSSYATQSFVTSAISSAQASTVKYGTIDPLINTDIIDRPMIVDPYGNYHKTEDYILGQQINFSNNGNTKYYNNIIVKGGTIVQNYKNYNKVNNEWELTMDYDYTLVGFPDWESPIQSIDIYNTPDFVIPDGFDLPYEFFVDITGGYGMLIGRLYDGEIDGTPTLNYTGIKFDSESGIYGLCDYMAEDDGQGNVIYNEYIHQFMIDEDFQAFVEGDFADLSGRVSALESDYGDAVTETENILGE